MARRQGCRPGGVGRSRVDAYRRRLAPPEPRRGAGADGVGSGSRRFLRGADRHVERELAEGPHAPGGGVARAGQPRRPVPAGDQAVRRPVPGHGFPAPGLRVGPPRRGPVERRGHPVEGGHRRRGRRLRRRPGARSRRPHRVGHLRRRAGRVGLRAQRPRARRTTTTATSSTGWAGCATTSTPTTRPTSCSSSWATGTSPPTDVDVWSPAAFEGSTHVSAAGAGRRWPDVRDVGPGRHAPRALPRGRASTRYWDYRNGDFHKKRGMRIDYLLSSTALARAGPGRPDRPQRPQGRPSRPTTRRCWGCSTSPRMPPGPGAVRDGDQDGSGSRGPSTNESAAVPASRGCGRWS